MRLYRSGSVVALAGCLALGLGASDAARAAGYYSGPRSEAEMARCWDRMFKRYGTGIRSMEQQAGGQSVLVRFNVAVPGHGERVLICNGATGGLVKE